MSKFENLTKEQMIKRLKEADLFGFKMCSVGVFFNAYLEEESPQEKQKLQEVILESLDYIVNTEEDEKYKNSAKEGYTKIQEYFESSEKDEEKANGLKGYFKKFQMLLFLEALRNRKESDPMEEEDSEVTPEKKETVRITNESSHGTWNYVKKLDAGMFEDIVAFSVSEAGAMGPNDLTFYKKSGESFSVDYKAEETPYEKIKECFPVLYNCYFDGPMRSEPAAGFTITIGGDENARETHVAEGWKHLYLDYGNHMVIRENLYRTVKGIFRGKSNCNITYNWTDFLDEADFAGKIDEVSEN